MILTEEQRAAIKLAMKYIARWPFAYKELYARGVLQAMIDSSEHTREPPKMVGFDLERARGLRDFLQDDCAEVRDVWAEMIAEIERLQGFETAARDLNNDLIRIAGERDELAARIQVLEDALVEERGNKMIQTDDCTQNQEAADIHHRCICEYNVKKCPVGQWWLDRARVALQAEGKIGPDDSKKISHLRPYEVVAADLAGMLAKSWQITDERKAAIQWAEEMAGDCKAGDVLRDMLAEVTR